LLVAATFGSSREASAQRSVNDRLDNRPFASGSQAESYLGMTVGDLVVALGLRLQGVRQDELGERLRMMRAAPSVASAPPTKIARRGTAIAVAP
jgi:hypothetical protein